LESLLSIDSKNHLMSTSAKTPGEHIAVQLVIFDQENLSHFIDVSGTSGTLKPILNTRSLVL
jgi:hypothetical protein